MCDLVNRSFNERGLGGIGSLEKNRCGTNWVWWICLSHLKDIKIDFKIQIMCMLLDCKKRGGERSFS